VSKTVLIVGTSSGLGEAAVFEYAERGWNVVAAMRDVSAANPKFAGLENVAVTHVDVTDRPSVDAALVFTAEKFGELDALLNVAGYGQVGAIEEVTPAELRAEYETNVVGVLNVAQAVLPQFRARRGGHVLVVGSMSAHLSFPTFTVYASSKAAVRSLVEGLQMEGSAARIGDSFGHAA
jgi:NADP-dependent 3-hydroxy acid dehydrogenase YdfG